MPIQDPVQRQAYGRAYGSANRAILTKKKAERREQQRAYIIEAKNKPCVDCGVKYPPWVMEFDHVRGSKRCNVSFLARKSASWETITTEIEKCDVVCRNCHAQRTHDRSLNMGL